MADTEGGGRGEKSSLARRAGAVTLLRQLAPGFITGRGGRRRMGSTMGKRLYFNAFHMNCVVHQSPGLWVHPDSRMDRYTDLETWTELAQLLEQGKFDGLFLADVIGVYGVFRGNRDVVLRGGVQVPVNDPSLLIPRWCT
jgi:hypothetical protein